MNLTTEALQTNTSQDIWSLFYRWQKTYKQKDREPPLRRGANKNHTAWQNPTSAVSSTTAGLDGDSEISWGWWGMEVANAKALIPHPCLWKDEAFGHQRW